MGGFSIKINDKDISESTGRTKKLWKLFNLLILNRNKPLSIQTIVDSILYDENIEFANKALHNLIFRLKNILSANDKKANYIIFSTNGYMLDVDQNFSVDIYDMEDNYAKARSFDSPEEEKIACYEKIIELYNGEYLPNLFDDLWKITATSHFDYIFVNTVVALSDLYMEKKEYEKLFKICDKAVMIKPIEESIYMCMIKGMILTHQTVRALNLCDKYIQILYKEMGIQASKQMQSLYALLKEDDSALTNGFKTPNDSQFPETSSKAFFCSSKLFNEIYNYELRQTERKEKTDSVMLMIDINKKDGNIPSHSALNEAKKQLRESCFNTMRKGDIFTAYSDNQYIVLLANIEYENHGIIINRLKNYFYDNCKRKDVFLNFKAKPVTKDLPDIIDFPENKLDKSAYN